MKKASTGKAAKPSHAASRPSRKISSGLIHPVVVYPIQQPTSYQDLKELYGLVARLEAEKETYARPLTVMDRKTYYAKIKDPRFRRFRNETVARHSDLVDAWCVDTCQMWYSGLGAAFERGKPKDIYWLIPGDFNYGSVTGHEVLSRLHDLPEICVELEQDVCIGEIATDHNHSKQLIDTYGTFALLYNWFPKEAQEIRQFTERPRSEFIALRHAFLGDLLQRRWYAYEQTVVILLQAIFQRKSISRFFVGHISDLPEGRDTLASAMQQVERTERILKTIWRERHQAKAGWTRQYHDLELKSEQVLRTALMILESLLS